MHDTLPDAKARALALDPTRSLIVQAPAGSGKTELLIQRILVLLSHVDAPEEILAITFTKKAAHEMRARVIKALQAARQPGATINPHQQLTQQWAERVLARDQAMHWHLIDYPNRLRIQTIDSFNAYLTKQLPLLSHISHNATIANQPTVLYREAVQDTLNHLENGSAWSAPIAQLLLHLDNDMQKCQELLMALLMKRDQWLPYIMQEENDERLRHILEEHLLAVTNEHLQNLQQIFPQQHVTELLFLARFAAKNIIATNSDSMISQCDNLFALSNNKLAWQGIAELLLTATDTWRKKLTINQGFPPAKKNQLAAEKMAMEALIADLSEDDALLTALAEVRYLPDECFQDKQWQILNAVIHVLKILAAELQLCFQRHGKIDYIENAQAALLALGSDIAPTDLALALDYRIQHILVDEFQDTSYTQYRLLEKLTAGWQPQDGRSLFIVGDPMQSIYRFREAEVGLFIRACQRGIGHLPLEFISLSVNFRSVPAIIAWFNHHFGKIFPGFASMVHGAVPYHPSSANPALLAEITPPPGIIEFLPLLDAPSEAEAQTIATLITQLRADHPTEKIAILVRSRNHLLHIIPALKTARLSFRAIDIDSLAERQTIIDLHALTRAMLHPADRLAWLACLRAPWCGFSLQDLWTIAHHNPYQTVWEQLQSPDLNLQLSSDGQKRLAKLLPLLASKMVGRLRTSLRQHIESLWLLLGGPACLHHEDELENVEAYFQLLASLEEAGNIARLDLLAEAIDHLYAIPDREADDSLQIMTIHAAKGLEFDTVILPRLEHQMRADDKALLTWMEQPLINKESALLLASLHAVHENSHSIYDYIRRQQKLKSELEMTRLLYVAATRAKKRLYLSCQLTTNAKGDIQSPTKNTFLEKLWPVADATIKAILSTPQLETLSAPKPLTPAIRYLRRLTADWVNPIIDIKISDRQQQKKSGFQLRDQQPQILGTVIHRLLQQITLHGTDHSLPTPATLANYLRQCGIRHAAIPDAAAFVCSAINNTLADPRGQWLLQAHKHHAMELAVSLMTEFGVKNYIIDRTFIDAEGVRWIVDYKTSLPGEMALEAFLAAEQEQYHEQLAAYGKAMQSLGKEKIKFGLYFPGVPAWVEWE